MGLLSSSAPAVRGRAAPTTRRRLGEVLVEQGVLTEQQLQECLAAQAHVEPGQTRLRLGRVVVERGHADERQIANALAGALGLQLVDLSHRPLDPEMIRLLPRPVAERLNVLVLSKEDRRITVATADPTNVVALDDVRLYTGATELQLVVATETQVREQLGRGWSLSEDNRDVTGLFEDLAPETAEEEATAAESDETAPIIRLVDVVFADAARARVSDVHVEPQDDGLRIRYRVDGLLRDVMTVPKNAAGPLVSRIKIVSGLDIAEKRRPQDGRTRLKVDGHSIDARVSTLPTLHGEKVVVRLLARADAVPLLAHTGLDERQLETLLATLTAPQGLVLITGPTGSGKTNTLYSAIQQVSTPDRNIVALEDPVEIQVSGITQVQVNERAGMTFARGLKSVLRQDPDIVLVGEVRDSETAELALQASLTGHLVLTTLHTNDAVSAVTRLVDMGVEPFLVASSLSLVVAQRLVRKPCGSCITPYTPSSHTLDLLGLTSEDLAAATPRRGKGCPDCGSTGYRGRAGIFEVLPVTAAVRSVLLAGGGEAQIAAAAASAGMVTLRAAALAAAARGDTTYDEVLRVTSVDSEGGTHCRSCARGLADDMVACPWCATVVDRGTCSGCDRTLDPTWRICPWCQIPNARGPVAETTAPSGGPPRLLVVDPDPGVSSFVEAALVGTAEVTSATSGQEALALAGSRSVDAVLVDSRLTDMPGVELIRLLRADASTATLPLLLFARGEGGEAEAGHAGADGSVAKPIEPAHLEERVRALLTRTTRG
jgi:type IV pilus assembly protein PilB